MSIFRKVAAVGLLGLAGLSTSAHAAIVYLNAPTNNINENTLVARTLVLQDIIPHTINDLSISGGADALLFQLTPPSGLGTNNVSAGLRFVNPPDFENPLDAGGDNIYEVTVRAKDSNGPDVIQNLLITVDDRNDVSPIPQANSFTVNEGAVGKEGDLDTGPSLLQGLVDPDTGDSHLVEAAPVSNVAHGTLVLNNNGTFVYTHNGSENFSDAFTYRVRDAVGNLGTATVTITITPVNENSPVVPDDSFGATEGLSSDQDSLDNGGSLLSELTDVDTGDTHTVNTTPVVDTSFGALTLSSNGNFSYTHNGSENFSDTFTYQVLDAAGNTDNAVVTISIAEVNDNNPVPQANSFTLNEAAAATAADLDTGANLLQGLTDVDTTDSHTVNTTPTAAPSFGALTLVADGTFSYTHNGSENFSDSFTYQAIDAGGNTATAVVSITINEVNENNPVPQANSFTLNEAATATAADLDVGVNLLQGLTDVDTTDSHTVNTTPTVAPSFGTLTLVADGTFSYTHNGSENFSDSFTYQAIDAGGNTATAVVSITINEVNDNNPVPQANSFTLNEAATATAADLDTGANLLQGLTDVDTTDSHTVNTTPTVAPSFGALTLVADGTFSYTHNGSENFSDSFTYQAIDAGGNTATAVVSITVNEVNENSPVPQVNSFTLDEAATATAADLDAGANLLQGLTDVDTTDSHTVNTTPTVGPTFGALTLVADGTFSYTHNGSENFSDTFTYQAVDAAGNTATAVVSITINEVNDNTPVPQANTFTLNEAATATAADLDTGANLLQGLTDVDTTDSHTVNTTPTVAPSFGALTLVADGTFSYTHNGSENFSDSFTYQAIDAGGNTATAVVSITINEVNDNNPVPQANSFTLNEAATATAADLDAGVNLLQGLTDVDTTDSHTVNTTPTVAPSFGALTLVADGTFSYTHNGSENFSDSFTYQAIDAGGNTATAVVSITINEVNENNPVPQANSFTLDEAATATAADLDTGANLLQGLTDVDTTDSHTVNTTPTLAPSFGALTLVADGTFSYTHNGSENFSDSFTYQAIDAGGNTATAVVSITINEVNENNPVPQANSFTLDEAATATAADLDTGANLLQGLTDVDTTDSHTVNTTPTVAPSFGALTLVADGTFSYTHNGSENFSDSFTYQAIDAGGNTATAVVSITINEVNENNPVPQANSFTLDEAATATAADLDTGANLLQGLTDVDTTDSHTVNTTPTVAPSFGALTLVADGTFSYTHNGSENFSDSFTYQAIDAGGNTATAVVSITINEVNENSPVVPDDAFTVAEAGTATQADLVAGSTLLSELTDIDTTDSHTVNTTPVVNVTFGALTLNSNGNFSYTHDGSENFSDTFTYQVIDANGNTDTAVITITITEVNENNPVPQVNSFTLNEAATATAADLDTGANLLQGLTDVDTTDSHTVNTTPTVAASFGALTLVADGTFSYTHNGSENFSDSFTYQAIDAAGNTATAVVSITINEVNENSPVVPDDAFTVAEAGTATQADLVAGSTLLSELTDIDTTDSHTVNTTPVVNVTFGALTLNSNGSFSYTHDGSENFSDTFTYQVIDANGNTDTAVITITITEVNENNPVPQVNSFTLNEAATATAADLDTGANLLQGLTDVDTTDSHTVNTTPSVAPSFGALTLVADGTFSYTHNGSENFSDTFTYQAVDAAGNTATAVVSITINEINENNPVPQANTFTLDEAATATAADLDTGANLLQGLTDVDTTDSHTVNTTPTVAPSFGALTLVADGTFSYTHNGSENFSDSFTYQAIDAAGNTATAVVSITIDEVNENNPVPQANSFTLDEAATATAADLDTGANLLQGLTDVDTTDSHTVNTTPTVAPSFGALTLVADGTFSYTHNGSENFSDTFTYQAVDAAGNTAAAVVSITINEVNENNPVPQANTFTLDEAATATAADLDTGANLLQGLTDVDTTDSHTVNTTPTVAPSFGALTLVADGTFSYTHNGSENFSDSFTYQAIDAAGNTATAVVSITINEVNENSPVVPDDAFTVAEAGTATQADLVAGSTLLSELTDIDTTDSHTVNTTPVVNVTFGALTLNSNGNFSYTHNGSENFSDTFTYEVIDANGNTDTAVVTITITEVNENSPVVPDDAFTIAEAGTATQALLVTGSTLLSELTDIDTTDSHTVNTTPVVNVTFGALTLNSNGNFSYTHDGSENFSDTFTYEVIDANGNTDTAVITITITEVNENNPVPQANSFTLNEAATATAADLDTGANLLQGLNDVDTTDSHTVNTTPTVAPLFGALTLVADGTFSYTHNGSENFSDTFTYQAIDAAGNTATAVVSITINEVNENSPVVPDDAFTVAEAGTATQADLVAGSTLLSELTDIDTTDSHTVNTTPVVNVTFGALTLNSNGNFSYTHNGSENFSDTFTYEVIDANGNTDTAVITITITEVNENSPVVPDDAFTVAEAGTATQADLVAGSTLLSELTDIDTTDSHTVNTTPVVNVTFGALTLNSNGSFSYTHDGSENFSDTFTYQVIDANGNTDTAVITITITEVNENNPVPQVNSFTLNEAATATAADLDTGANLLQGLTDVDTTDSHTVNTTPTVAPSFGALTLVADGTFSYTHNGSENFSDSFTYQAIDAAGNTATAVVSITINEVNENSPVVPDDAFTVAEAGTATQADLVAGSTLLSELTDIDTTDSHTVNTTPVVNVTFGALTLNSNGSFSYTHDGSENFSDTFTYQVIDANGNTDTAVITITITEVNENSPVVPDDAFTIAEAGTATQAFLNTGTTLLSELTDIDTTDSHTVNTTPVVNVTFGALTLNSNGNFSYTHNGSENYVDTFTYEVIDANGNTDTATISITVSEVNDNSPIPQSNSFTIGEGGTATNTDLDAGSNLLQALIDLDGTDSHIVNTTAIVDVSFGTLTLNADGTFTYVHDDSENLSDTFTFQAIDAGGNTGTAVVNITITGANDNAPIVGAAQSFSVAENTANMTIVGTVTATDIDNVGTFPTNWAITAGNGIPLGAFAIDGSTGVISINDVAQIDFESSQFFDLTIQVEDGANTSAGEVVRVNLTNVNEAPTALNMTSITAYNEDAGTVSLTDIVVSDIDESQTAQAITANLTLSDTEAGALTTSGSATYNSGSGLWTITDTLANVNAALAAVSLVTGADHDTNSTITTQVIDQNGAGPANGLISLNVTALNDTPDATNLTVTTAYTEDQVLVSLTNIVVSDVDDTDFPQTITAILTLNDASNAGSLTVSGSASYTAATGIWTITDSLANVNSALAAVQFLPSADYDVNTTITTQVNDVSPGPGGVITLDVTPVNDNPTATNLTGTITYNEDAINVDALQPDIVITDVDDADYPQTITVTLTLADYLPVSFSAPGSSSFDSDTGVWTMTDTVVNVNAALAALTFNSTLDWDDDSSFQVSISDQDLGGPGASNIILDVIPANDEPVVADQTFDIDENSANGTVVGTVVAVNAESIGCTPGVDAGCQDLSYLITGGAFAIDTDGVITVANASLLDRESVASFTETVTVTDDGTPIESDTAVITIDINPVNDNTPSGTDDVISVNELATVNFNVLTLGADADLDLPAEDLTVSAVDGDPLKVGVAQVMDVGGVTVGTLTISEDGSATFVTSPDNTVEKFQVQQTYTVSDGLFEDAGVLVTIDLDPQNDNQPELTAAGTAFAAAGVEFDEGDYTSSGKLTIILNDYFIDLDIDEDGILDSSTSGDNDSLVFSVQSVTNSTLLTAELNGGDLAIYSPADEHGTTDVTIRATDTASPLGNVTSVDLTFTVTVNSINDAPTYTFGTYSSQSVDEDSGSINLPLDTAFTDNDIDADSDPLDDSLTYTITVIDTPNPTVQTFVFDDSGLPVISETLDSPAPGARTVVIETTNASVVMPLVQDAHGSLVITVRATDEGRPPELPADAVPLFDEETITVTVNGIGDDTPDAEDDHYNDFPVLIIDEDSDAIIFDPTINDYLGDTPTTVLSAGVTITDSFGADHTWRSTSRMTDRDNTGDFVIEINGEVSCAGTGCQDDQTPDTQISGGGVGDTEIQYRPRLDFNGEDTFTYCIQDGFSAGEAPFTPPADDRCATITVLVNPVNDLPRVPAAIIYTMDQADDLIISVDEGLKTKVTGVDNTHVDGLGCNPNDPACMPLMTDPQPDELFFFFNSAVTTNGQLIPPFETDGSFNYRPSATFSGSDSFLFDVCETAIPTAQTCVFDVLATIVVESIDGAPEGLSDEVVEVDFDLADIPLELPVGPEANVLIVNDDSGSMDWDILTDQTNGLYYFSTGNYIYYTMKATAGNSSYVAPSEEAAPNQGLWRLRSSVYNKVYYNPDVRYTPWDGLDPNDDDFADSTPNTAIHNPMSPSGSVTNLRSPQDYTGRAVLTTPEVCETRCSWFWRGSCRSTYESCTGGSGFQTVTTNNLYLPRYYVWDDKDSDGNLDSVPSPEIDAANSEGILVEIRPASESGGYPVAGSGTYPKTSERTDCITNVTTCSYTEELQNFANWFTYARNREFTAKSALGKVVSASENIRIGYAKLNSSSNLKQIESMNTSERTGTKAALLDAIYLTESSGGTPLRRSLRDAGRHFECRSNDIFNSSSNKVPGDVGCPVIAAPGGNCQQNFALLISDGAWNGGDPSVGDEDDNNNTNFDGGVYASSFNNSLADVAMEYYERDLHATLPNEVPTSARDTDGAATDAFENGENLIMHQHMKTFTVGFGVNGIVEDDDVPTDYTQSFNWGSPTTTERKVDDMRHAALNGRGEYLSAGNAKSLADALVAAFEEFQQGSGAASAVSFNSQEILEDTLVFRSFYNTKNNTGDLIAQAIDPDGTVTEEPTWNAAEQLDLIDPDDRHIITFDRDPLSPNFGLGIPFRPLSLNDEQRAAFIADAGAPLAQQELEVNQRVNYLRGDNANERPVGNFRERPGIEGRLGDIVHSSPTFISIPSRLGRDAAPFPQSTLYSSFKQANELRDAVVYVASNDGMVHGFDAESGDEVIAYVPDNLMTNTYSRKITELLNYEYTHKYFVDSTPAVNDVFIDADGDGDKEWRTIMVTGQGAGAKAYFALDVTDPTKFDESTANQVTLWEFTDMDDTYPTDSSGDPLLTPAPDNDQRQDLLSPSQPVKDMGYSFSVPTIAMSNIVDPDGENRWVAIAGNGYNSTAGIAKLFVLYLDGGVDGVWCHPDMIHTPILNGTLRSDCIGKQDFIKLDTGFGVQAGVPNGLGEPRGIDTDGNGTVDYVYAGDMQGNFFRFDLTDPDPANWETVKIFQAQYKPGTLDETDQPVTTQPIAIIHPTEEEGFILIFGTGSYNRNGDSTDPAIQSIYGLWDRLGPELILKSELQQQSYTNITDPLGLVRTLSDNAVDYSVVGGRKGWYIDLDSPPAGFPDGSPAEFAGEKAVRNIQLRGGLAFVNSIFPREQNSCVGRAGGATLSFCPDTGGSLCFGNRTIFDLNNDGAFDDGDDIDTDKTAAGIILQDPSPPTDSTFIGDKRVTQYGRELHIIGTNTSSGSNTGRLSWKRLETVD